MNLSFNISQIFSKVGFVILAILVLLLLIMIHEFGHFIAGKILKFKINEFSIGFGPKIFQKTKKNKEKFTLRLFPLGGYCAFEGENEDGSKNPEAFNNQKPWKRLIVLFCGAFFNFLSAIIFSFILLISVGYDYVQVKSIDNSINSDILQAGDVIRGIENERIDFVTDKYFNTLITIKVQEKFENYSYTFDIATNKNFEKNDKKYYISTQNLIYNITRNGVTYEQPGKVNVVYSFDGTKYKYESWTLLNDNVDNSSMQIKTYKYSFGETCANFIPFTFKWAWKVLCIFGQLITGQLALTQLGGPVTTINMIATYSQINLANILLLLPVLSVNLAVFNLLPIPALDGFQMVFVIIEWIRKKPVKQEVVNTINNVGLIVLLAFVILVDILQIIK